jgi:NADH:ubiquinone oxidoreductase subunit
MVLRAKSIGIQISSPPTAVEGRYVEGRNADDCPLSFLSTVPPGFQSWLAGRLGVTPSEEALHYL